MLPARLVREVGREGPSSWVGGNQVEFERLINKKLEAKVKLMAKKLLSRANNGF